MKQIKKRITNTIENHLHTYKNLDKQYEEASKKLWHLSNEIFSCERDTEHAVQKIQKSLNDKS